MLEGWKDVQARGEEGVVRSCGWRASLNGRAQRGESGRRFWARRFSPVERVFTAECVGVDGSLVPRANRVDGERFSVTSRIYKRAATQRQNPVNGNEGFAVR